jgi:ADP-heptose:LPS heptosyltransferase
MGDKMMDLWGARGETRMIDMASSLRGLVTSAAVIDQLDIVITVDTAVAHLNGAMSKPVSVLPPFSGDSRWDMAGDRAPWYPTMRLFRQRHPGNRSDAIKRMATTLRTAVAARLGVG